MWAPASWRCEDAPTGSRRSNGIFWLSPRCLCFTWAACIPAGVLRLCVFFGALDDRSQEALIVGRLAEPVENQLRHRDRVERLEALPQNPDLAQLLIGQQQFLAPGAGQLDVDRRERPPLLQLAVEVELHVAGALELLVDHVVHPAAGVDQRRRDDRDAAALLDLPRGAEEALGAVQRRGVETAGERPAARRDDEVVGPGKSGEAVEQDDDVAPAFDEALGALEHE